MERHDRLRQLEAWWASIWEASPDAILLVDESGLIEDCNPSARRMFGCGRQAIIGKSLHEIVSDPRSGPAASQRGSFLVPGKPAGSHGRRELRAGKGDGTTFPVRLSVGAFSIDGRKGLTVLVRDISGRKRAEARLRQREEQLSLTIRYAPTGICTVDLNGGFLTVNDAFCAMVGYSERELLRRPVNSITHPDDVGRAEERLRRLRAGEIEQYRVRKRYVRKDGGIVEAIMTAAVVHDFEDKPLLYVAQVEDLTERINAEREANESRERLAHVSRVQLVGEMVAGIAHEINQPLAAIATYAQASSRMIRAGMLESDEMLGAMDKIGRQAQRAGDVIRRLRQLVRQRSTAREMADLNELVSDIVPLAEVDARMHETSVQLNLSEAPLPVLVDPVQIQQVVLNLLRNGMEAMDAQECEERRLVISTRLSDEQTAEISVEDRGAGITDETEKNLFRTFFTTKDSGMGMGLAISRTIAKSHRGSLWFTRNRGRGITFHLSLPIGDGEAHG